MLIAREQAYAQLNDLFRKLLNERIHLFFFFRSLKLELLQLLDERQLLIQPLAVLVPMRKQRSLLHTLVHTHIFMVAQ